METASKHPSDWRGGESRAKGSFSAIKKKKKVTKRYFCEGSQEKEARCVPRPRRRMPEERGEKKIVRKGLSPTINHGGEKMNR